MNCFYNKYRTVKCKVRTTEKKKKLYVYFYVSNFLLFFSCFDTDNFVIETVACISFSMNFFFVVFVCIQFVNDKLYTAVCTVHISRLGVNMK